MLTTREIAKIIGGTPHNVRARISKGWKGEHLLVPLFERRRLGVARTTTQVIALKLAHAYPHKIPTVKQIQQVHPMSNATARYWRNAIKLAQEEA